MQADGNILVTGSAGGQFALARYLGIGDYVSTDPTDQTVNAGQNATFSAASLLPTDTVQWYVSTDGGINFAPLNNDGTYSGVTTGTLTITGPTTSFNNDEYEALFTNTFGSIASNTGLLTVTQEVTAHIASATAGASNQVGLTLTATDTSDAAEQVGFTFCKLIGETAPRITIPKRTKGGGATPTPAAAST